MRQGTLYRNSMYVLKPYFWQIQEWLKMMKQSCQKFPLNYLSCLLYILKTQDATIGSLFYFLKLPNISGSRVLISNMKIVF